jgi:hypothetical protein
MALDGLHDICLIPAVVEVSVLSNYCDKGAFFDLQLNISYTLDAWILARTNC